MTIQVNCPNGHSLSCPDDRAGRQGRCPKCGASFQVPAPTDYVDDGSLTETAETFWFLCPNGHKLNGPTTLQGRPGKCPHCAARFIIPSAEEAAAAEDGDDEELASADEEASFEMVEDPDGDRVESGPQVELDVVEFDFTGIESVDPALRTSARPHVMAALFNEFWNKRGAGTVELQLRGGGALAPDWFATELSQGRVGVFGLQDVDGSYSLAVIAWDAVERLELRGLGDLPRGMFD